MTTIHLKTSPIAALYGYKYPPASASSTRQPS